jgi:hypothetical protein
MTSLTLQQLHPACVAALALPGVLFRGMVIAGQAVFFSAFAASYMVNPKVSIIDCTAAVPLYKVRRCGHQSVAPCDFRDMP